MKTEVAAKLMGVTLSVSGTVVSVNMDLGCRYAAQVYFDDNRERAELQKVMHVWLEWKDK